MRAPRDIVEISSELVGPQGTDTVARHIVAMTVLELQPRSATANDSHEAAEKMSEERESDKSGLLSARTPHSPGSSREEHSTSPNDSFLIVCRREHDRILR